MMKISVMIWLKVWTLAVEMIVSVSIESEWMMTFLRKGCLVIQISAALPGCNSGNAIGLWFDILPLISSSVYTLIVDSWYAAFFEVSNSGGGSSCCSFSANFLLDWILYNYLNGWL